ncbi:hypothetical protein [Pedobacter sp. Leaf170]|uniref:hypothetical protein n=1 Tax=Pedobacter sp. Leaf170 TaxID=2876558 RepID=UPI001E4DAA91|nr:hypothetical protein [Pedobacter sp. Leaf170]
MNITQLEKSQKIYNDIKTLDAEIIELDKVAHIIANGNATVNLSISVIDNTLKESKDKESILDEDGSLKSDFGSLSSGRISFNPFDEIIRSATSSWPSMSSFAPKVASANSTNLETKLNDNLSLNVLAILLYEKQERRKKLIKQLNRIGVTI